MADVLKEWIADADDDEGWVENVTSARLVELGLCSVVAGIFVDLKEDFIEGGCGSRVDCIVLLGGESGSCELEDDGEMGTEKKDCRFRGDCVRSARDTGSNGSR